MILNKNSFLNSTKDTPALNEDLYPLVKDICDNVKYSGDAAIRSYNKQFDQVDTPELTISPDTIKQAYSRIDSELKNALIQSYERIKAYQQSIKWEAKRGQEECYELYHPLDSVGIYVPGGKASYPSTVLMTATLAQVAGVNNIVVVTPPQQQGVSDVVLAACYITGITSVYQVGGAQSIAALTYGTETIPKVDKIVGPGNQFVAYAKKYLFGTVGIDQIAGPSEIALIIDDTADLEAITYDVFAQAEHDELARTFVISEDLAVLESLEQKITENLSKIERHDIVKASIENNHYLIHVDHFEDACEVMNDIAPEHASIQTKNPEDYLNHVRHVGALFLGYYSPEVIGDYVAGPSHVLPTNQNARFANGLSVNDFLTRHSVINLSQQTFDQIQQSAQTIAHTEQLFNHEQSIKVRINKGES
ncbi:histidinol dehydrogenase [Helicobacter pylori]